MLLSKKLGLAMRVGAQAIKASRQYEYDMTYVDNPMDTAKEISYREAAAVLDECAGLEDQTALLK